MTVEVLRTPPRKALKVCRKLALRPRRPTPAVITLEEDEPSGAFFDRQDLPRSLLPTLDDKQEEPRMLCMRPSLFLNEHTAFDAHPRPSTTAGYITPTTARNDDDDEVHLGFLTPRPFASLSAPPPLRHLAAPNDLFESAPVSRELWMPDDF